MEAKFRFWDTLENKFFEAIYKPSGIGTPAEIRELLVSQNGELFLHEQKAGCVTCLHEIHFNLPADQEEVKPRYLKDLYSGVRDKNGVKYYFNDIVCFADKQGRKSWGVLVWMDDCLAIGSGPINNYTAVDQVSIYELKEADNVGNIYQHRHLIMGDEGPIES